MSTSITVRDVPDQTRDELASRAALSGRSLQEYLRAKLIELARQPASMVVAGLTDTGADGRWAEALLAGDSLAAPHLMPVEAGNILRRAALAGDISADVACCLQSRPEPAMSA
jgi:plasmid stability protein